MQSQNCSVGLGDPSIVTMHATMQASK